MKRVTMLASVVAVALLAAVAIARADSAARADDPMLVGDVGLNEEFVITLTDGSGNPVKHLDPGTYTLLVHDRSVHHNFDLVALANGATPAKSLASTTVNAVGDQTFTITLVDGKYEYRCDPHPTMIGLFSVGTVVTPPKPPAPPLPLKLSATVPANGAVALSAHSTPAGRYVLVVRDRSKSANFHLVGPGVNRRTGITFVGSTRWSLTLSKGTYRFGSDSTTGRKALVVR